MPITIKDMQPGAQPVQRGIASLVGGVVIAMGCFVLWLLCASQLMHGTPSVRIAAFGAVLAGVIGIWIRLADL